MAAIFYLLFLLCCIPNVRATNSTRKIRLLTLLPYPNPNPKFNPSWNGGPNIIPAMDLAAKQVNERGGFLDGYQLELVHMDGGCNIASTTFPNVAFGVLADVVGLVGPGCSSSTLSTLYFLRNRTSFIAVHGAGSPRVNREAFPNSFGTLGSTLVYVDAVFAIINKTGWRKISLLVEAERPFYVGPFNMIKNTIRQTFPDLNIRFASPIYDNFIPLQGFDNETRVAFVFASADLSRRVLCLALRSDVVYPRNQWVFISQSPEGIFSKDIAFTIDDARYGCSSEELRNTAMNGSIFLNYRLLNLRVDEPTFSGLSYTEYFREYTNAIMEYNANPVYGPSSPSIWAPYFYDAVWAWAIVLDNVTKSSNFSVEQFQFDQPNDALIQQFEQVDFEGVSGRIKFDSKTGSVNRIIDIMQVFNGNVELIGFYNAGMVEIFSGNLSFIMDNFTAGGRVPHPVVIFVFTLPLLVQCAVVVASHVVVVVYRNVRPIKASSPNISHLGYIGVYFFIASGLFATLVYNELEGLGVYCQIIWAFLMPYGFTLSIGSITVKTLRIYRIFIHTFRPGGKFVSDPAVICYALILLSVNVIISIVWTIIDPIRTLYILDTSEYANPVLNKVCSSGLFFVWLDLLIVYCLIQLITLSIFVCLTRNIERNYFQTVRLQMLVFATIGVMGIGLSIFYYASFKSLNPTIPFILLELTINLLVLVYFLCVLLPPVVYLIRHKKKQKEETRGYTNRLVEVYD